MRDFLKAESYFIRRDIMFKGISLLFLIASLVLAIWIGGKGGFEIGNLAEPLTIVTPLSLFFYFIIPVYVCFLQPKDLNMDLSKLSWLPDKVGLSISREIPFCF